MNLPGPNLLKYVALGTYLGFAIASPLIIGMLLGQYLDRRLGTGTVLTFAAAFLGLLSGLNVLYRTVVDIGKRKD